MKTAKTEWKRQTGSASKTVVILLSLIILLLVLALGGAAWAITSGRLDSLLSGEQEAEPVPMTEKPVFKPLNKFVVSLAQDRLPHYLMLELTLVSHHPDMPEQADSLESVIPECPAQVFLRSWPAVRTGPAAGYRCPAGGTARDADDCCC